MASRIAELAILNAARQKRAELEWLADCERAREEIAANAERRPAAARPRRSK